MSALRFFWKVFAGYIAVIAFALLTLAVIVVARLQDESEAETARDLDVAASLVAPIAQEALRAEGEFSPALQEKIHALGDAVGIRLTVITTDGVVLADSEKNPAAMDNHASRPEIQAAIRTGHGTSQRFSNTIRRPMMYVARRVEDDGGTTLGTIRTSVPVRQLNQTQTRLLGLVGGIALLVGLFAAMVGYAVSRGLSRRLSRVTQAAKHVAAGDYSMRITTAGNDEVDTLAQVINRMAETVQDRMAALMEDHNKLAAILTGMVEGVIAIDQNERVLHINEAAGEILSTDTHQAVGQRIYEVSRIPEILKALEQTLQNGDASSQEVVLWQGGRERTIELHAAPLMAVEAEPGGEASAIGAVAVLHDITEVRRLAALQKEFVANVSHELKTPLTAMRGLAETILDDPAMAAEQRNRFLDKVRNQVNRLEALVTDLLSLSRLQDLDKPRERERVNLCEVVSEVARSLLPIAQDKGLQTTVDIPEAPVALDGDREGIRQAIGNLVDNAMKYTPAGGQIAVRLMQRGDEARIVVEDSGIGIHPRDQERIFERFYRADKGRSRDLGGTGLGLSIVKHTVRVHDGNILLDSIPGEGSTFTMVLPTRIPRG